MELRKLRRRGDEGTCVYQDVEWWSRLAPEICDMILEKLPTLERLRLRIVCKDWNCNVLQRLERKPYFVTIFRSTISSHYLSGVVVYDVVSKSLCFEPLPLKLHQTDQFYFRLPPFAVEGLILMNQPRARLRRKSWSVDVRKNQWCVYNIHTRTTHLLPRAPGCDRSSMCICGMMVDTSIKPHTFKLVVSNYCDEKRQIYDSASRTWSSHPKSNPNSNLWPYWNRGWYFCMCHKNCMYMATANAMDGVFVYSMEEDQWSRLSGSPFRGMEQTYLGVWDDRIFAVLHDPGAKSVTVWELIDATQQEWVEYAGCSKAQYEHLTENDEVVDYSCKIVSVFNAEYVLMYNWKTALNRSDALVLLNLKTSAWEPVVSKPNIID
ncbi:hypothetical protein KC19_8G096000 [Ceratodon purpureus]|uniref:F-box domain-containing protein n=1 Tax=Ceratodon purpureus TaxID=3225 RepID=A0A8T0GWV5_CERPU|nr:hypothetical protein KC19_8G096000 [Ceratodon purpureus]